jgi:hypothetical protein
MIYFTTFILTLLLSHIARATSACDSSEELHNPYADSAQRDQDTLAPPHPPPPPPPTLYDVTWAGKYANKSGDTKSVTCSNLAKQYPHFGNFPHFPYIGGAWNIVNKDSKLCGTCWNLTDPKTRKTIFIILIDHAKVTKPGWYNTSQVAFNALNGGHPGNVLQATAKEVDSRYCHPKK